MINFKTHNSRSGKLQYEALPDRGEIVLQTITKQIDFVFSLNIFHNIPYIKSYSTSGISIQIEV